MQTWKARVVPQSAFGTHPKGDSLFGQLCWAARNRFGESGLNDLLQGYTQGRPYAVVSDALPVDHLPRPVLPSHWFTDTGGDRKAMKKRAWLPLDDFGQPVVEWLAHCRPAQELPGGTALARPQPHNSINRTTNTTGSGFDPYGMEQHWYGRKTDRKPAWPEPRLDLYVVLDEARLPAEDLHALVTDMGAMGFGRDASIGLGKFTVETWERFDLPAQKEADTWLTLAPCAPQGMAWNTSRCFYEPFTRFGRHGDIGVHLGNPFKTPVLLADTGAVLTPRPQAGEGPGVRALFIGQGLGGDGSLSKVIAATVHQGYAPVVGIRLPDGEHKQ